MPVGFFMTFIEQLIFVSIVISLTHYFYAMLKLPNKPLLTFLGLAFSLFSYAQNHSVSGIVQSVKTSEPIEYASIVLVNSADSSTTGFTFSEVDGKYTFDKLEAGNYFIEVLYTGYEIFRSPVVLDDTRDAVTINVKLSPSSKTLSTTFINAKRVPMAIRGDTIVYNPNAFTTKTNATVEDLLKKLPGVQVSKDGKVTTGGEQVVRVLVNGKEFFGKDPTKATQNIDANSLEKVEILDRKSDDAEFSGVDDGQREKVINLVLKKDANKGFFGKLEAGLGTEETYRGKGTINYFKDENQITAIGNLNNLNQNGFNWQEYYQMLNGQGSVSLGNRTVWYSSNDWLGSQNQGRQENAVLGTNAHLKLSKTSEIDVSYFLMNRTNDLTSEVRSENYLPGQTIFNESSYNTNTINGQHKGVFKYTLKPDSMNWVEVGFEADFSDGTGNTLSMSENRSNAGEGFLNTSMSRTEDLKFNNDLKASITWRHKFRKSKNSFNIQVGGEDNRMGDTSNWVTDLRLTETQFNPDEPFTTTDRVTGQGTVLYGLGRFNLGLDSFTNLTFMASNKLTIGALSMQRILLENDSLYTSQSPTIDSRYRTTIGEVRFNKNQRKKGWYKTVGLGVLSLGVNRELSEAGNQSFTDNYLFPYMSFWISHRQPNKHRLGIWFNTQENFPNPSQINPVQNPRNPISITQGVISLDPSVTYNWGGHFNKANRAKNRWVGFNVNQNLSLNPVVVDQLRTTGNETFTTYFNDKYTMWNNIRGEYGITLPKLNLELSASAGASNYRFFTRLNEELYLSNRTTLSIGADLEFETDFLEFYFEYDPDYTIQTGGFSGAEARYWQHNFYTEIVIPVTDRLEISSDFDVFYFEGGAVGGKQIVPVLNSEITFNLDTNGRWQVGLIGFDMLNQNQNIDRNFFSNSFMETRQNSITRFFMYNLKYTIRRGKKKQESGRRWRH